MKLSIICPLYNAEKYIKKLDESIWNQKKVDIESIMYILTESDDNTQEILDELSGNYKLIKKDEFSHSLTREEAAMKAKGDIIVFITQDIIIKDELWLYNLTLEIENGNCEAAFSRQICEERGIEKYIRPINYPKESRIVSKSDLKKLGLMTFFFSDVSSAISKKIFLELNGYDNKKLPINEDMYIAYKIIFNGYKIRYCSESVVVHSHKFTCKQLFQRYYAAGRFFAGNRYLLKYSANRSGARLTKLVLQDMLKSKDYKTIFTLLPNFTARFLGMHLGKMEVIKRGKA